MAEEITKVIENVDKLFPEIVINGESHVSERYVAPPQADVPASTSQTQGEEPTQPQQTVQGEYVDTLELNGVAHDLKDSPLSEAVDNIEGMIPNQASAQNQLADKNFVNSSIATNTANFLGTYSTLAEIEAIPNPTNNDYAFLETADTAGNNVYDRYKYNAEDGEWLFEYELNNSSFTAEQWATINSGLTQTSVENLVDSEITEALTSPTLKQPIFDFIHPIGETYTQYPEQIDPVTLYNQGGVQSTWILLDYGGAFFRAEGGNALAFNNSKEVTAVSGAVLTIPSSGAVVGSLIYDPVGNETRTVTAVSGNNITVNSAFTSTNLTNVLIGQNQGTAKNGITLNEQSVYTGGAINLSSDAGVEMNHSHSLPTSTVSAVSGSAWACRGTVNFSAQSGTNNTNLRHRHKMTFTPSVTFNDTETRPENYTVKVWKRTA